MAFSFTPSDLTFLGIAKETTSGTAVAPSTSIRVTAPQPTSGINYLQDTSMDGSVANVSANIQGLIDPTYQVSGYVFSDEIGWFLASMLNDLAVTGAADPYTTTFAALNSGQGQPSTYTITDYNGVQAYSYAGCVATDLSLTFGVDALATYSATFAAAVEATASAPTATFGASKAQPSWRTQVTLNSLTSFIVQQATVDMRRAGTAVHGLTASQNPSGIFAGADMTVDGTLNIVYRSADGETGFGYFKNGTTVPLIIDLNNATEGAGHEIKATMSQVTLNNITRSRASASFEVLECTYSAAGNTTDVGTSGGYSPAKWTTKSSSASGTYK